MKAALRHTDDGERLALHHPVGPDAHTHDLEGAGAGLVVRRGHELKLVYPQAGAAPEDFAGLDFERFSLQPMDGPDVIENTARTDATKDRLLPGRSRGVICAAQGWRARDRLIRPLTPRADRAASEAPPG